METGACIASAKRVWAALFCVLLPILCGCYYGGAPSRQNVAYTVQRGDTLYSIGRRFNTSVDELRGANRISDPRSLRAGQSIKVPTGGGQKKNAHGPGAMGGGVDLPVKTARRPALRMIKLGPAQEYAGQLAWPLPKDAARFSSEFNWRWSSFHEGIDLAAPAGTPVYAAHAGRVIFSGRRGAYGNLAIVRGDHILTVYGHNSSLRARRGDLVKRGEIISYVGATGNASGPHLHFETRIWDPGVSGYVAVDPGVFYK